MRTAQRTSARHGGHYVLDAEVRNGQDGSDLVTAPWVDLSADRAVTVDARTARPVTVTVERLNASLVAGTVGFVVLPDSGGFIAGWIDTPDLAKVGTAQIGPDAPASRFTGGQQAMFAVAGAAGDFTDSP